MTDYDITRLIETLENLEVAAVDMGDYIIIPMVEWDANMNYRWQTAKQERLGSCPQVPSKHPQGPASDYCEKQQKEAFRQRLGDELFDYLEELAEKEAQDEKISEHEKWRKEVQDGKNCSNPM